MNGRLDTATGCPGHRTGPAAAQRALLDCFQDFLLGREVPWRSRQAALGIAGRFLDWFAARGGIEDLRRMVHSHTAALEIRESFLRVDCADRYVRHDLRPQLNQFLVYLSRLGENRA